MANTNNTTLKLVKMGCNFFKDDTINQHSDLGNHRFFARITTGNNQAAILKISAGEFFYKLGKKLKAPFFDCCIHNEFQKLENGWPISYGRPELYAHCEPTQKAIIDTINRTYGTNYQDVKILDQIPDEKNYFNLLEG